ncbi:MAG: hypothetical protein HQL22_09075 [Candidatus Omnitrophica bacterium]|nr:hypothetical protein [Candidatus Omnitrophota bacterium]
MNAAPVGTAGNAGDVSGAVRCWALVIPFVLWLWLHHWGAIGPQVDNTWYSHWIAYHFGYLAKGIFPLWDPFRAWGWPDIYDVRFFGDLNPFYLIVPFLMLLHVPPFVAFNAFLVVLYLLGGIGFYLCVKTVWSRELPALVAYAMFMLSTIGELLFSQLTVMLMLFSSVWIFYFLAGYIKSATAGEQKKYFAGLVFTLMLVVSTYVPFFFVVSLSAFILAACLFSPAVFISVAQKTVVFIRTFPVLFWMGGGAVALACLPGLFFYLSVGRGDIALIMERNAFGSSASLAVPLGMISHSSLAAQVSPGELFSDQDFVFNTFCYVPVFLAVVLSLGCFTRMDARHRVIFATGFFIFLFALAGVTPVHAFLYEHVGFVRLFRNLYFLGPLIMLVFAALAGGQLQSFLEARPAAPDRRVWYFLFILLVHAGWLVFLFCQERVLWTTFATVIGSAGVFALFCFGAFDRHRGLLCAGLLFLAMLQPSQVIMTYWSVWGRGTVDVRQPQELPFSYRRPFRGQAPELEKGLGLVPKTSADESGFRPQGFYGTHFVQALYSHVPAGDLQEYVAHKFVLYEQVALMPAVNPDWEALRQALGRVQGPAWVNEQKALELSTASAAASSDRPVIIEGPSEAFKVVSFDPDHVRLVVNYPVRKFLVYNDSYYPGWRVFINGRERPLYRANAAFKGVWVEAGRQEVEFRFGSLPQYVFHWAMVMFFAGWGGYAGYLLVQRKKCDIQVG